MVSLAEHGGLCVHAGHGSFIGFVTPNVSSQPVTCPFTFSLVLFAGQTFLTEITLWVLGLRTFASLLFSLKTLMIPAVPFAAMTPVELTVMWGMRCCGPEASL